MHRRRALAGLAACGCVMTAGCLDTLVGRLTTHTATPVEVREAVATEQGYEHQGTDEDVREETVARQRVEVTSYAAQYERRSTVPGLGEVRTSVFGAASTPQVSLLGTQHNPIADLSTRELVDEAQETYTPLSVGDAIDSRTVPILGHDTEVETFEGEALLTDGLEVEVRIDIARFDNADDHLVAVGVYPELLSSERERIDALLEGLEHG
ncbi:DUF6517 family protein [Natronobiforma cellulositropha]|uniref:DUF6517 family protein n=1 Tax=Natronobiforma cellulositropha TaxID=1679076 RepID=UPI0021D5A532|nr:DUF6517 family protein [Natronobiforma cellulositropha]